MTSCSYMYVICNVCINNNLFCLPLAVAGDKLKPVGGPVDDDIDWFGVVGVIANELWWFSVCLRNDLASQ